MKVIKFTIISILVLYTICTNAQPQKWFWGFSINPQHSEIFNSNDRKAASVEPGTKFSTSDPNQYYLAYNTQNDNGEFIVPNSIRLEINGGYSASDYLSVEGGLAYSYQQQKYNKPTQTIGSNSSYSEMKNTFHIVKIQVLGLISLPLGDYLFVELGLGVQPSYLLSYGESRSFYRNDGSGYVVHSYVDNGYRLEFSDGTTVFREIDGEIFNSFNLEGRALLGLRWGSSLNREYFLRFTADHSLFDIENKSAKIEQSNGEYAPYYGQNHTPFKYALDYPFNSCPDCEAERPSSYNFTAGISIGVRFYLK